MTLSFTACEETVTLSYSESTQGSILEKDLSKSPEDNLKIYLASAGASFSKIKILNKNGATCACTLLDGKCTCKLNNSIGANAGCDDVNSKCTADKMVKIEVDPNDVPSFNSLGFK